MFRLVVATAFFVASAAAEDASPYKQFEILTASSPSNSRSKEWKPGDGISLEVGGMAWIGPDLLAVAVRKGEVWFVDNALSDDKDEITFSLFASGLHEPLGLLKDGADLLVTQRGETTRLQDRDGDGVADAYLTEASGWNVSGNYHAYAYGPERDGEGNLWVSLNLGMGNLADNKVGWRGWGGIIENGKFLPKAFGMRSPSGLGANLAGDMFFTDQQGTWIPATPIYHLRPGVFYGNQESLESQKLEGAPFALSSVPPANVPYPKALASTPEFVPPAVWLPYNKVGRSATDLQVIDAKGKFGPFDGQFLVGEFTNAAISRVFLEKIDGEYQGACFPFLDGFASAVFRLEFAPDGSLFVGMTNRGWSSLGNRSYGLTRVRHDGGPIFAIKEMKARPDGFELVFTEPVDAGSVSLEMSSFTYEYSSRYGGEEIQTKQHEISHVAVSGDGLSLTFDVAGLRPFFVHELRTKGLKSRRGRTLDHPDAYYTLNRIPEK